MELTKQGDITGAMLGFYAGAAAAVVISLLCEYGILFPMPLQTDNGRISVGATVAFMGGLWGAVGCSVLGAGFAWILSSLPANLRRLIVAAVAFSHGLVGATGGLMLGFFLSGAGHDGEPIRFKAIAVTCVIGTCCGLVGGILHGHIIGNCDWGRITA